MYNKEECEIYDRNKMIKIGKMIKKVNSNDIKIESAKPINHIAKLVYDIEVYIKGLKDDDSKCKKNLEAIMAEERLNKIALELIDGGARLV